MKSKKIVITIAENIRGKPYEILKPNISVEYEVPEGADIEEFYQSIERLKEFGICTYIIWYIIWINATIRKV